MTVRHQRFRQKKGAFNSGDLRLIVATEGNEGSDLLHDWCSDRRSNAQAEIDPGFTHDWIVAEALLDPSFVE